MHLVFRVLGWTLLVAVLVGVLWPERAEPPAAAEFASAAPPADPGPVRAPAGPPASSACEGCGQSPQPLATRGPIVHPIR